VAPGVVVLRVLLVATIALSAGSPAFAKKETTPPTFAGLASATTCIPGPGGGTTASYRLSWEPATDNRTPVSQIVYDVYQATAAGGEDFSVPTYTTRPGASSFETPQLPTEQTFYFAVRARDKSGNSDSNKVERRGENLCV
jgi:hypothetical protein